MAETSHDYVFADLAANKSFPFNPAIDSISFNGYAASSLTLKEANGNLKITVEGKSVTLKLTSIDQITGDNFVFTDGSMMLIGTGTDDTATGGSDSLLGSFYGDQIYGLDGNDVLNGGFGVLNPSDKLFGGEGNDTIDGANGADTMTGGNGNDVYYVDDSGDSVVEGTGETSGVDQVYSDVSYTLTKNVENLTLGSEAGCINGYGNKSDNIITGNDYNNNISGDVGNDQAYGGCGWDTISLGVGNDIAYGGGGNDWISGAAGSDVAYGGWGCDTIDGGAGDDLLVGEGGNDSILGAAGNDHAYGGCGNDTIDAGTGNDSIEGGDGNDVILAGAGNDIAYGGAGCDTIDGGTGNDHINAGDGNNYVLAGTGNDTVHSGTGCDSIDGGAGNDVLVFGDGNDQGYGGAGNDSMSGGNGADTLSGDAGNDSIDGGDGCDVLVGGLGNDSMWGGYGNDTYVVDSTGDVASEAGGTGTDTVLITGAKISIYTLGAGIENADASDSTRTGLTVLGNELNNDIVGSNQADKLLSGGEGNDTIDGGEGNDTMSGGNGDDLMIVDENGDNDLGGAGTDTAKIVGSHVSSFTLAATTENLDASCATNGFELLKGNALANNIWGSDYGDTIHDGDTSVGGGAGDNLYGGYGNDTITATYGADNLYGGNGSDSLSGGAGADTFDGGEGNDTIDGGDGNDSIQGGLDSDSMTGGNGDDVFRDDFTTYGNFLIDGGSGFDAIAIAYGQSVTFAYAGNIDNVEAIYLTDDGGEQITIGAADVFNMTSSGADDTFGASHQLHVEGDASDSVVIDQGEGTFVSQGTVGSYTAYYDGDDTTLYIDSDIIVSFINEPPP